MNNGQSEIKVLDCGQPLEGKLNTQAKMISALVSKAQNKSSAKQWSQVLGRLDYDLMPGAPNSDLKGQALLGYWMAEAIREVGHADFAIIPRYAVGLSELKSGDITRAKLLRAFPVDENIYLVDLSGKEILRILNQHADHFFQNGNFLFYYAGKDVTVKMTQPLTKKVKISGMVADRLYKVITLGSIMNQSPKYLGTNYNGMATPLRFKVQKGLELFVNRLKNTNKKAGLQNVRFKSGDS